jgi:hypothetical protein
MQAQNVICHSAKNNSMPVALYYLRRLKPACADDLAEGPEFSIGHYSSPQGERL